MGEGAVFDVPHLCVALSWWQHLPAPKGNIALPRCFRAKNGKGIAGGRDIVHQLYEVEDVATLTQAVVVPFVAP